MLKLKSEYTPTKHLARNMTEGQLFIKPSEALTPENVKMAVSRYSDDDDDVIFIYPFAQNRLCDGINDLQTNYVSSGEEVQPVEFVGELMEG